MKNTIQVRNAVLVLFIMLLTIPAFAQNGNCLSGNCRDGVGTYLWNNGEKYVGGFQNGEMHGTGTYAWPNGHKYEGEWRNGRQNGLGTYVFPSGKTKYGQWQNGAIVKEMTKPSGNSGTTVSSGTNTSTRPTKTTGCVSGNCENGSGLYIWSNGEKYEGQWNNGKFHGKGAYTWVDGSKFSGNWVMGEKTGYGTYYQADGTSQTGNWQNGELAGNSSKPPSNNNNATTTTTSGNTSGKGCIKGNCKNGVGLYVWPNGDRYEGEFLDGKPHGAGTKYYANKGKYIGEWKKGKREGRGIQYMPGLKKSSGVWFSDSFAEAISGMAVPETPIVSSGKTTTRPPTTTTTRPPTTTTAQADTKEPELFITEPAVSRGFTVVTKGNSITVKGYATDESGVKSVRIAGVEAKLSSPNSKRTNFEALVTLNRGQSDLWAEAVDNAGNRYNQRYNLQISEGIDVVTKGPGAFQARTALVIGNSNYSISPLPNARNDADSIAMALKNLGFEVMHYTDLTYQQMEAAINDYGNKLRTRGGVGMFYYAGHGIQIDGQNYLVPTSASIRKEKDIKYKSVHLGYLLDEFEGSGNDMNIVVLDACRDNPFSAKYRSIRNGLAGIAVAPIGTFIAYATSPGSVASDGDGTNGLYTQELLKALRYPRLKIEDVFKVVRANVRKMSQGMQVPWENSSIEGDFYFKQ